MTRSVLLIDDQRAGRFPDHCALSGVHTEGAVRVTAVRWSGPRWVLGIPGVVPILTLRGASNRLRVALPVSPGVWRRWQRRNLAALSAMVLGLVFIVVSSAFRGGDLVALGVFVALAAGAYRTRVARNHWLTCELDPSRQTVTVEPTHLDFDRAARTLFERSLHR
jgi:hypothetical protein